MDRELGGGPCRVQAQIRLVTTLVAVVGVLTLAVLGAATGEDWELEEREFAFGEPDPVDPDTFELPVDLFEPPELQAPSEPRDLSWVRTAAVWLGVVAALIVAWQVWRWARRRLAGLAPRRAVRARAPVPTDDPEPEVPVLRRGIAEASRSLRDIAEPTDAVVAAWVALEAAAEESGVRRGPALTPTEFTVAVLDRTPADPVSVRQLLSLYHRARFSRSPIGPDHVEAAAQCLRTLASAFDARDASPAERT